MINKGNRTEWSQIRSVIIQVINKIRRPRMLSWAEKSSGNEVDLFIFVDLFQLVGELVGFKGLIFGPAGPDFEPGRYTFLSTLVF